MSDDAAPLSDVAAGEIAPSVVADVDSPAAPGGLIVNDESSAVSNNISSSSSSAAAAPAPAPVSDAALAPAASPSSSSSSAAPPPSHNRVASSSASVPASASASSSGPGLTPSSSDVSSRYRRQLQLIRASDLEQEAILWSHATAAEDTYWQAQFDRYAALLKRAQTARDSTRDLNAYLRKSSKLLSGLTEHLAGLGQFGATDTGTVRTACVTVEIVGKTTSSYLSELNLRVFDASLRASSIAADDTAKLYQTIETSGNEMVRTLKAQRKSTIDAWMAYIRGQQERTKSDALGGKMKSDPFLLVRQYESELSQLQILESKFQTLMTSLLKDVEAEDLKRMTSMRTIMQDNLIAQKAVLEQAAKFTDNALQTVRAINPEADRAEFVSVAALYTTPTSPTNGTNGSASSASSSSAASSSSSASISNPPSLDSLITQANSPRHANANGGATADSLVKALPTIAFLIPPPARDPFSLSRIYAHEIEKEGALYRQGSIVKSNWKACTAILTSSGFLHLFEGKQQSLKSNGAATQTLNLSEATIESCSHIHPHAFSLKFTKSGFSLSGSQTVVVFRADNQDALMEWMLIAQKHSMMPPQQQSPQVQQPSQQQQPQQPPQPAALTAAQQQQESRVRGSSLAAAAAPSSSAAGSQPSA